MGNVILASSDPALGVNMDTLDFSKVVTSPALGENAVSIVFKIGTDPSHNFTLAGTGLTYTTAGAVTAGSITALVDVDVPTIFSAQGFTAVSAPTLVNLIATGNTQGVLDAVMGGADSIQGSLGGDLIRGGDGNDTIFGDFGADSLYGGNGDDVIYGRSPISGDANADAVADSSNYIRGEDGNDSIIGGSGFDDINGNKGNDTAHGGLGNDWVVGGQDNDLLYGDNGNDIVYGNLGNDTLNGGDGDDWVRGGQGDDVIFGGAGNDLIWGDRGNDTITGGAGADIFHSFIGAGVDRITDFNYAEGDRLVIDGPAGFTLAQAGADGVVTLAGGDTVVLVGVNLDSLPSGWISIA